MADWIDRILLDSLQGRPADTATLPNPLDRDCWERPAAYRGWVLPLRTILALRYLKRKAQTLAFYAMEGRLPTKPSLFLERLQQVTLGAGRSDAAAHPPRWTRLMRAVVFYPILAVAAVTAGWFIAQYLERMRLQHLFAVDLVRYSELLHKKLESEVLQRWEPEAQKQGINLHLLQQPGLKQNPEVLAREATLLRQQIVAGLPRSQPLRTAFDAALKLQAEAGAKEEDILQHYHRVNRGMAEQRLPFYLVPKTVTAPCWRFLPLVFSFRRDIMQNLEDNPAPDGQCQSTMLLPYGVERTVYYRDAQASYPVFYNRRLDKTPLLETALGLTYRDGLGSQVLMDRVEDFIRKGLVPAFGRTPHNLVLPPWLRDRYRMEQTAANTIEKMLNALYGADSAELKRALNSIRHTKPDAKTVAIFNTPQDPLAGDWLHDGVDALTQWLHGGKPPEPALRLALPKLEQRLAEVVAVHEAKHQINATLQLPMPEEIEKLLKKFPPSFRQHVMDELSAYLVGMYFGEKIRPLLVIQLASFALNVTIETDPAHYAARIILAAFVDHLKNKTPALRFLKGAKELAEVFPAMIAEDRRIGEWTKAFYKQTFGEDIPAMAVAK